MRIGLIAPPWVPVPPPNYGGTESVVDNLARALQDRGHEVTLFSVGTSTCPVPRRHFYAEGVDPIGTSLEESAHVLAAYEAMTDVDVIHDHTLLGPLLAAASRWGTRATPLVVTSHGPFTERSNPVFRAIARRASIVAISRSQARGAGGFPVSAVIHHGIDLSAHWFGPGDGGYLLFVGRMNPVKGVHRAVLAARQAGVPLVLVTKMQEREEYEYFEQHVRPLLPPESMPPTELGLAARARLMAGATALLNPITWDEPFGLVMAEALAAGTPVLAFPRGAAPEIVQHGRTGFLCDDVEDMARHIRRVDEISREACRSSAEQDFGAERMARDYEALYERLVSRASLRRGHRRLTVAGPGGAAPPSPLRHVPMT